MQNHVYLNKSPPSLASIETYSNQHLLCEGSTLEELAGQLGIPADQFAQAVSRYNAWQKTGHDDEFGRSATGMPGALETAPFYAVRVKPAIHYTMGGLSVNTETQVLRAIRLQPSFSPIRCRHYSNSSIANHLSTLSLEYFLSNDGFA